MQKDNSTFRHKLSLRRLAMAACTSPPIVLETHGGEGNLYAAVYAGKTAGGVVFEKDGDKAEILARQRPTWAVYQAECEPALRDGAGAHLVYDLIDVDPYGSPFEVIEAILAKPSRLADRVQLVVNDGLRQTVKRGGAWRIGVLRDVVAEFGNDIYECYQDVAKEKIKRMFGAAGFEMTGWRGYYATADMTHYWATLQRVSITNASIPAS